MHGVHDFLTTKIPVVNLDPPAFQVIFLVADNDTGDKLICVIDGRTSVVEEAGEGMRLARLSVTQKDHLDLVQKAFLSHFKPFQDHLMGLIEDGHVHPFHGGVGKIHNGTSGAGFAVKPVSCKMLRNFRQPIRQFL